jgi:hypothetical protein
MRSIRSYFVLLVLTTLIGACGGAPGGGPSTGPATQSPSALATQTPAPLLTPAPGVTPPLASVPIAGGNSLTYDITGEYEASGSVPFDPEASILAQDGNGWIAYFGTQSGDINLRVSTRPDKLGIEFRDGEFVVVGNGDPSATNDCTFNTTENDASALVGSAECKHATVHPNGATFVNMKIQWDVRP